MRLAERADQWHKLSAVQLSLGNRSSVHACMSVVHNCGTSTIQGVLYLYFLLRGS